MGGLSGLLGLWCLLAGAAPAPLQGPLTVPLSPAAEAQARALVAPLALGEALSEEGPRLLGIRVGAHAITYAIGPSEAAAQAEVRITLDAERRRVDVTLVAGAASAASATAAAGLRDDLRERLAGVTVQWPEPPRPDADAQALTDYPSEGWPLAQVLLGLFAILLVLGLLVDLGPRAGRQRPPALAELAAVLAVAGAFAAVVAALPDTVLYHRGHAWLYLLQLAGDVAVDVNLEGTTFLYSPAVLGGLAAPGQQAFLASRVAGALCVLVVWAWVRAMTASPRVALVAAGALAVQPALLFASRAAYPATTVLLLLLLTLWLGVRAAQSRRLGPLLAAAGAAGLLAMSRNIGPFLLAAVAPLALLVRSRRALTPRERWIGWGLLALLAAPVLTAWVTRLGAVVSHALARPDLADPSRLLRVPLDNLLADPHWVAPGLTALALIGLLAPLHRAARGWIPGPVPPGPGPAPLAPWRDERAALALIALSILVAVPVVVNAYLGEFLNNVRFHLALLVPLAVGVALAVELAVGAVNEVRASRSRWAAAALAGLALSGAWGLVGLQLAAPANAVVHPDAEYLAHWREVAAALPEGATLIWPQQRGDYAIFLPTVELAAARPDITLLTYAQAIAAPALPPAVTFWVAPLYCTWPQNPDSPPEADRWECREARRRFDLQPVLTRRPRLQGTFGSLERGPEYWISPPLPDPAPVYGLYRVL